MPKKIAKHYSTKQFMALDGHDGSDNSYVRTGNLRHLLQGYTQIQLHEMLGSQSSGRSFISRLVTAKTKFSRKTAEKIEKAFGLWPCSMEVIGPDCDRQLNTHVIQRIKVTPRQSLRTYNTTLDLFEFVSSRGTRPRQYIPKGHLLFSPVIHDYGKVCGFEPSSHTQFHPTNAWKAQIYIFSLDLPRNADYLDKESRYHNLFTRVKGSDAIELGRPTKAHDSDVEILGHCLCTINHV